MGNWSSGEKSCHFRCPAAKIPPWHEPSPSSSSCRPVERDFFFFSRLSFYFVLEGDIVGDGDGGMRRQREEGPSRNRDGKSRAVVRHARRKQQPQQQPNKTKKSPNSFTQPRWPTHTHTPGPLGSGLPVDNSLYIPVVLYLRQSHAVYLYPHRRLWVGQEDEVP